MRLPRPSLVRRLTVGFILSNAVAVLLFVVGILYMLALIEEDEPVGPEVMLALVQQNLSTAPDGAPIFRPDGSIRKFALHHPGAWFVAQGANRQIAFGPVPEAANDRIAALPGTIFQARYRNLGAEASTGDAITLN